MRRNFKIIVWSFCVGAVIASSAQAVLRAPSAAAPAPLQGIVKLKASLAASVEAALPSDTLELKLDPSASASNVAQQFLLKHRLTRMRPLYGEIMRRKKD